MAGATIRMTFDDAQAAAAIGALRAVGQDPTPLLRAIGVALAQNTRDRFNAGHDPDNRPWAPLSPDEVLLAAGTRFRVLNDAPDGLVLEATDGSDDAGDDDAE